MKEYKFISFKRNTERDEILLDIVGFHQSEPKKEQILSFII
jgi:hypothetical protein